MTKNSNQPPDPPVPGLHTLENSKVDFGREAHLECPRTEGARERTIGEKLLVIGLDGVTFDGLDPLVAAGRVPMLARLIREGVRSELTSTFPPITAVAWTSLATGKNPGKHGIFEFILSRDHGRRPLAANATARDGEAIWEMMSRAGLGVLVTNFPCTYPPQALNGVMISDFMTPAGRRDFVQPPGLLEEIEQRHGAYRLYLSKTYARGAVEAVLTELHDELEYKSRINCDLMQRRPWDACITHIWGTDRIQHELWHITDPSHPRHDPREASAYAGQVLAYWEAVDREVGRMIEAAGESASVWVVSDHGFGPAHRYCAFNLWLLGKGLLRLKPGGLTRLKRVLFMLGLTPELAYRLSRLPIFARLRPARGVTTRPGASSLLSKLFLSFNDVDWSRTRVYSKGNYGQIFINLKGREPQGIVEPGEDYQRARREVIDSLREIVNPDTGEKLIGEIWTREQLYSGPHLDEAPDVCFLPRDMRYLAQGNTDFNSRRFIADAFTNSGCHRMNGVLIARGARLNSGMKLDRAGIYDVAPTLLYQLGLTIPEDMDGRVLNEIFDPAYLKTSPPQYAAPPADRMRMPEIEVSPEEVAEIEERLKSLGYLG